VDYRGCQALTLFGPVVYERAYYHCGACGQGWFPTDAEFGLERKQTPAVRELLSLAGVLEPFAQSGETLLPRLSGLTVSAATVRRTAEAAGADVAARRAKGEAVGGESSWSWHRDATGRTVACVSLDATGVRQQGPRGEQAEGRMAWVGAVFNPAPPPSDRGRKRKRGRQRVARQLRQARYVSGLMSLPEIGGQLRRECRAVGLERADVAVAVTDGGAGLEDCLLEAVGGLARETVFVLDYWHVMEHVREFAKLWLPEDQPRRRQVKQWSRVLRKHGGGRLWEQLQALDVAGATAAAREAHRLLVEYLRKNLHRTHYPDYLRRGWPIGSGVIEAACKTVVGQRLKGSGMRWRAPQTTAMCQLRALYRSSPNLWANYWRTRPSQPHLQI